MPIFTNNAEVNTTDSSILCGVTSDTDSLTTEILAASEALTVSKTVSDTEICADGVLTYTLTVRNTSAATKTFDLVDTITVSPSGTILPSDITNTNPVASSITQIVNGVEVKWLNTTIPGKAQGQDYYEQTYTITLAATCAMVGTLTNKANIIFSGSTIPSNEVTTLVKAVVDLSIVKTKLSPADPVYVDDTIEYNLAVTNNGPCDATGVYIDDTIPATALISPGQPGWILLSGTTYRYTIGTLASGATVNVSLKVVPTAPTVP